MEYLNFTEYCYKILCSERSKNVEIFRQESDLVKFLLEKLEAATAADIYRLLDASCNQHVKIDVLGTGKVERTTGSSLYSGDLRNLTAIAVGESPKFREELASQLASECFRGHVILNPLGLDASRVKDGDRITVFITEL